MVIRSEPLIRVAEQYLHKGSKVYVEGQLETRKWQDKSDQDRYTTEVTLRPYRSELTIPNTRGEGGGGYGGDRSGGFDDRGGPQDGTGGPGGGSTLDDEIPF